MNCQYCQNPMREGANFCSKCGNKINIINISNSTFNNSNVIIGSIINGDVTQKIINHIHNYYPNIKNYLLEVIFYYFTIIYSCLTFAEIINKSNVEFNIISKKYESLNNIKKEIRPTLRISIHNELNQCLNIFNNNITDTLPKFTKYIEDLDKNSGILITRYCIEIRNYYQESLDWYQQANEIIKSINGVSYSILCYINAIDPLIQSEKTAPYFATTIPSIKHNLSLLHESFSQIQYILSRNNQILKGYLTGM